MIPFVGAAPPIEEEHGLFRLGFKSGEEDMPMIMTAHVLALFVHKANRALDAHHERQGASVVPFRQNGKRTRK